MRPELLAPAGSPESLRAAVQSGAGAVYLGWGTFNARQSAKNFSDEEFADALVYCHQRGVRVFLTLNTLLTDRELPQALDTARTACRLGVDAVLVQDWGLLRLLRAALPDLPVHASTQMSIFTSGAAAEAAADGCERVVLARECSAEDTAAVCRNVSAEVEVFGRVTYANSTAESGNTQLNYYKTPSNRVKKTNGSADWWWVRSPVSSASNLFCIVGSSGSADGSWSAIDSGLSPFGCI